MSDFVTTSDGRIAFKKSEFKLMTCGDPNAFGDGYEISIWTESYKSGRIVRFPSREERNKAALEITHQLGGTPNDKV